MTANNPTSALGSANQLFLGPWTNHLASLRVHFLTYKMEV